jgi:hypothetical protein
LEPTNENRQKFISALKALDFENESLNLIKEKDFTKALLFYFGLPPERTDFMTHISGLTFAESKILAISAIFDGFDLKVIHINHLIKNKKARGRLKDLADIEQLELIIKTQS